MYSERRLGKTSLLIEFIDRKGNKFIPVYIDLFGMTTKEDLTRSIVNKVIYASFTKFEKIRDAVKDFFSQLKPKIIISQDGKVTIDFSKEKKAFSDEELVEVFDFPQKVAKKKKKRMVVIFDEFQEIAMLDGLVIEKLMRSRFQHHKDISYIFAGSKEHILQQMFEESTRAFFKFARPMRLGLIPKSEFTPFILNKFKSTGGKPSGEIIDAILDYTNGHPYSTQYLCHEIWYLTKSPRDISVLDLALQNIIAQQSIAYVHIWDELKSVNQRALLIGMALENKYNYSADFIERYKLKSQSQLEKSVTILKKKRIINDDGKFNDIFFQEWIKRTLVGKRI